MKARITKQCATTSFSIVLFIALAFPSQARDWIVSPSGKDNAKGTMEDPLQIEVAIERALPGDNVILRAGRYPVAKGLVISKKGRSEAWITIRSLDGEDPILDGSDYLYTETGAQLTSNNHAVVLIKDSEYLRFEGITVINSHSQGIVVKGPGTAYVDIVSCTVGNTYGSGIALWYADHSSVTHCEISGANRMETATPGRPLGKEAPHEALTVAGATNFVVAYNHLHHCVKEGIDVKEVSTNGVVHHNIIHDLKRQGLYVDAWFGTLSNIELFGNIVYNCEWGFAISVEGKASLVDGVSFHHNLLFNNRGSGIYFGIWGSNLLRKNISITNNTVVKNGSANHWSAPTGGLDLRSTFFENVLVKDNIFFENYGFDMAMPFDEEARGKEFRDRNITIEGNWVSKSTIVNEKSTYGDVFVVAAEIVDQSIFMNYGLQDYRLNVDSIRRRLSPQRLGQERLYIGALDPSTPALWKKPIFEQR